MKCDHDFHTIGGSSKLPIGSPPSISIVRAVPGVEVVCVRCGEVRKAYADGSLEIAAEGFGPVDADYDAPPSGDGVG